MAYYFADRSLAGLGDAFFPEPQIGIDSLDLHIGMAILYLYLVVSSLALLIRKFVQIYKITELYAYVEIVNLVVSNPGDSFVSKMLAAMECDLRGVQLTFWRLAKKRISKHKTV